MLVKIIFVLWVHKTDYSCYESNFPCYLSKGCMLWFMQFLSKLIQREFPHYVFLNAAFLSRTKISAGEMNLSKNTHEAMQVYTEMDNSMRLFCSGSHCQGTFANWAEMFRRRETVLGQELEPLTSSMTWIHQPGGQSQSTTFTWVLVC